MIAWVAKAVSEAEGHHKRYREYLLQDIPRLCPTYLDESWVSCLLQPPGEFPSVPPPSETPNGLSFDFHVHSFDAEQYSLFFICVFLFSCWRMYLFVTFCQIVGLSRVIGQVVKLKVFLQWSRKGTWTAKRPRLIRILVPNLLCMNPKHWLTPNEFPSAPPDAELGTVLLDLVRNISPGNCCSGHLCQCSESQSCASLKSCFLLEQAKETSMGNNHDVTFMRSMI